MRDLIDLVDALDRMDEGALDPTLLARVPADERLWADAMRRGMNIFPASTRLAREWAIGFYGRRGGRWTDVMERPQPAGAGPSAPAIADMPPDAEPEAAPEPDVDIEQHFDRLYADRPRQAVRRPREKSPPPFPVAKTMTFAQWTRLQDRQRGHD